MLSRMRKLKVESSILLMILEKLQFWTTLPDKSSKYIIKKIRRCSCIYSGNRWFRYLWQFFIQTFRNNWTTSHMRFRWREYIQVEKCPINKPTLYPKSYSSIGIWIPRSYHWLMDNLASWLRFSFLTNQQLWSMVNVCIKQKDIDC